MTFPTWVEWARKVAVGRMRLSLVEFYELSPLDFELMLEAYEDAEEERRWETAYWVSGIMTAAQMAGNVKHPKAINPKNLMKPFLRKKTSTEISEERQKFFDDFNRARKEGQ